MQTWGTVENILSNVERIKGRQGESIAAWGDKLLLAKRLTTIRLDVPIEFRPEELTMCPPNLDELRALFAELDFTMFLRDLQNVAPLEESDGPRQDPQRQLAEMARAKSAAAKKAALVGQGDLFAPADPAPGGAPWRTMRRSTKRMRCLPNPRWRVRRRRPTTTGSSARPTNCAR